MEEILSAIFRFYGLDWLTMFFGLMGAYLLSSRNRMGFVFNTVGCFCALAVAILSGQIGFIVYNLVFVAVMVRGYMNWQKEPPILAVESRQTT